VHPIFGEEVAPGPSASARSKAIQRGSVDAVSLDGIVVRFGRASVLRNLTLSVRTGELLVVAGPNGAGKTTLLQVMGGLLRPDAGRAMILGVDTTRGNLTALRRNVGFLPQHTGFDERTPVSVRRAVLSSRAGLRGALRRYEASDYEAAEAALGETGTKHLAERPVGALSGGERQKVLLARCLAQEPTLLLLDEPAANLDVASRKTLIELIAAAQSRHGLTVVMVTHLLSDIPPAPDRVALVRDGHLVYFGPTEGAFRPDVLARLYGRPVRVFKDSGQTFVHPL
jgi:ABC-type Mn2+/Zn2+ transport system ATPase subunit